MLESRSRARQMMNRNRSPSLHHRALRTEPYYKVFRTQIEVNKQDLVILIVVPTFPEWIESEWTPDHSSKALNRALKGLYHQDYEAGIGLGF